MLRRWFRSPLAPAALIGLGGLLRLRLYLANPSLPIDEASLGWDLMARSYAELLGPLGYPQIVPQGFLMVEKTALLLFGPSEYSLRLFPLLCSVAGLGLCWRVARRLLNRPLALCALFLCAINVGLIDFSLQVKQYPVDIAASLLIALLTLKLIDEHPTTQKALWYGAAGIAVGLFSFSVVLPLAAGVLALGVAASRTRDRSAVLLATASLWMVAIGTTWLHGRLVMNPQDGAYLSHFWHNAFMPMPPRSIDDALWLWHRMRDTFGFTAGYRVTVLWIVMLVLGLWSFLRRRRWDAALVIVGPLGINLAASAAGLYPFWPGRLQIFLIPLLLIGVCEGVASLEQERWPRTRWAMAAVAVVMIALAVHSQASLTPDAWMQHSRPVVQYIKDHERPGDALYVYYGAAQAFAYYAPRYKLSSAPVIGSCARGDARTYLRELDRLRGARRVWLFITHSDDDERQLLLRYLDTVATRVDAFSTRYPGVPEGAKANVFAVLYDMSNQPQRPPASAETFPVPTRLETSDPDPWACYGDVNPRLERTQTHAAVIGG